VTTSILMAHRHRHPDDHIFFGVLGKCFEWTELERPKEGSCTADLESSDAESKANSSNDVKILDLRRKPNVSLGDVRV
jgi:hypothetical protein